MTRVLLLANRKADVQTERAVEALSHGLGEAFAVTVRTVGFGGDFRTPLEATRALRRTAGAYDVIHAFGGPALTAAALGFAGPIAFTPVGYPTRRLIGWTRAAAAYRNLHAVVPTTTMRRAMVTAGVPLDRCHLVRPGVDFARVNRRRDADLRRQLGFAVDDIVLLAAGESTDAADHKLAVWTASVLHVLEPRYRLLLWGRGKALPHVKTLADKLDPAGRLASVATERLGRDVSLEQLLPATDVVLVTAKRPVPTLPIAVAMAAGLPIVSTVTYTVAELLEDRHTALMVPRAQPRELARRVLDLRQDPSLQWSISDMARTEAFEFFAQSRFLQQHRTLYRQMAAGEKVDMPEQTAGAGLRFHGRA